MSTASTDRTFAPDSVTVGQVTTRKGYRLHLADTGRAHCGAGRGRIIAARTLTSDHQPVLCRRCLKAIRRAIADASRSAVAAEHRYTDTAVQTLGTLADALAPVVDHVADEARRNDLAAQIAADLRVSGVLVAQEQPVYPVVQPRTWADLREAYRRTHKQPAAA